MSLRYSDHLHRRPKRLPWWHRLVLCHGVCRRGLCSKGIELGLLVFELTPNLFQVVGEPLHLSLLALSKLDLTFVLPLFALQLYVGYPQLRLELGFGRN